MTYEEWKVEALKFMPLATEEELKAVWDDFKDSDTKNGSALFTFEEFEKALEKVRGK